MRFARRFSTIAFGLMLLAASGGWAQILMPGAERRAAGSLNTVLGAGARAEAMGGAFVAAADDSSATAWNPAGLARLTRGEVSLVYDRLTIDIDGGRFDVSGSTADGFGIHQSIEATSSGDYSHLGFAAIALPLGSFSTGFTYRKLSTFPELETTLTGRRMITTPPGGVASDDSYSSLTALIPAGDIYSYGLTLARRFRRLSAGASVNLVDADPEISFTHLENGTSFSEVRHLEFSEAGYAVGLLLEMSPRWSIGAVVHSAVKATGQFNFLLPASISTGVAFHPAENLMLCADYASAISDPEKSLRFGGEYSVLIANELRILLRAGYARQERGLSLYGSDGSVPRYDSWSAGGGMDLGHLRIDLAYVRTGGTESSPPGSGEVFLPSPSEFAEVRADARSVEVSTARLLLSLTVRF